MAGFTSEEVQAKINQFLRTQIKVGRTRIGSRDILSLRDEAYDLLTTTILLRSDSFFYIVSRTANRLEALRRKQYADVTTIIESLAGTTRRGVPIESTAELVNAQAALLEVNAGLNARQTGSGIRGSIGPGVERFNNATERFLNTELVPNVVDAGAIVETGDELRATIATLFADVVERHAAMVEIVDNTIGAIAELDAVRLPEQAVQGIVSRISTRLDELVDEMAGGDALALARGGALDLFVMRVLLARSSSFRTPLLTLAPLVGDSTTMTLTGTVPGEVLGTLSGPYNYGSSTILAITTTSGGSVNFTSPGDSRATIETLDLPASIPFPLGSGEIAISVDGGGILIDSWTGSTLRSTVAADIDALLGVTGSASVVGSKIVIQSASDGDESSLLLFLDSDPRKDFAALVSPQKIFARSEPPTAEEIAAAVRADGTVNADVDPEVLTTDYGTFVGVISAVGGEEDLLTVTGEDFTTIPVGTRVQVTSGDRENRGFYKVLSGTVGSMTVSRDFPIRPDTVTFNLFSEFLKLKATGTTPADGIYIDTAGDVQAAIGFSVDADLNKGLANTGTISAGDFLERGVQVGDLLLLDTDTPETARSLTAVSRQVVTFSPGLTYGVGVTTVVTYSIRSQRYQLYRFLVDGTTALEKGIQAWVDQWRDFTEMDRLVGQVVRGGRTAQAEGLLQSYRDSESPGPSVPADPGKVADLTTMGADFKAFVIPFEPTIDNILRLLSEQGMDRALELLVTLELNTFFTMSAEGVSFSTWLTRQSADTAREIAPVSKFGRGDKVAQEMQVLASQPDPFDPDARDFNDFSGSDDF